MQRGISGLRDSQVLHGKNLGLSLGLADPLLWWFRQERICLQCRRPGLEPWVGKIPLEEGMATYSMQSQRVGHDWATNISQWDKILGRYPYWLVWFEGGSGEISGRDRSARWWHSLAKPSGPSRGSSRGELCCSPGLAPPEVVHSRETSSSSLPRMDPVSELTVHVQEPSGFWAQWEGWSAPHRQRRVWTPTLPRDWKPNLVFPEVPSHSCFFHSTLSKSTWQESFARNSRVSLPCFIIWVKLRGAWQAAAHGVAKSWTRLSD